MPTGTVGNVGTIHTDLNVKPVIKARVVYSQWSGTDNTARTIGWLPPRAIITGGGVWVVTGFDDTTGDDLEIGLSGSDDDLYASAIDVNTGDSISTLDDLADANRWSTSARKVTVNFTTAPTGDGSTGEAIVWVEYVVAPSVTV
jgi:hypothetical protein